MNRLNKVKISFPLAMVIHILFSGPAQAVVDPESSARGVLERLIGNRADSFILSVIPQENGLDVYEIEARGGRVYISGSTGVAICRGAYDYLKSACHAHVSWEGNHLPLPERLPDHPKTRVVCPNEYRYYFNACTFGYTMSWWDWPRWEREIDWMALHGINMPLSLTGQEIIWQKVWRSFGLSDEDLESFFSGPAYLPWHRMGCLNEYMGPLPQSWIDAQAELQKKILNRKKELGMKPIVPGFSGFVPQVFGKHYPEAEITDSHPWVGFEPTKILGPQDPMFAEIGRRFIREYAEEFGISRYYLADTFIEMTPQVGKDTKYQDLAEIGRATYEAITAGDPEGVWVMQAWPFDFHKHFWGPKETEAYLSLVPDDRMIVLDLAAERVELWRLHEAVRNKNWIHCKLLNFGHRTQTHGNLAWINSVPLQALNDPGRGRMVGMGLSPEGIEQNPVVYELMTDIMWRTEPVNLESWLHDYCIRRYGSCPDEVAKAWSILERTLYRNQWRNKAVYANRPLPSPVPRTVSKWTPGEAQECVRLLISAADRLGGSDLFRRDLVDILEQYLSDAAGAMLPGINLAYETGDRAALLRRTNDFISLLHDLDRLIATRPEYRLSHWINSARKWGTTEAERDLYEKNARMIITVWGGTLAPDYAWKGWTGLLTEFYIGRWKMLFEEMKRSLGSRFDPDWIGKVSAWETRWALTPGEVREAPAGDTLAVAFEIMERYGDWPDRYPVMSVFEPGIAVGKPVTASSSAGEESGPENAVNGDSDGRQRRWTSGPSSPQWLKIDLEEVLIVGGVLVHPYWDWTRHYQYVVEVSLNGVYWTEVADMTNNTIPATSLGHRHEFEPLEARYVRVTMFPEGADSDVQLVEVRVYEAHVKENVRYLP